MLRAGNGRFGFASLREKYTFALVRSGATDAEIIALGAPETPKYRTIATRQAYVTTGRSEAMLYMIN